MPKYYRLSDEEVREGIFNAMLVIDDRANTFKEEIGVKRMPSVTELEKIPEINVSMDDDNPRIVPGKVLANRIIRTGGVKAWSRFLLLQTKKEETECILRQTYSSS